MIHLNRSFVLKNVVLFVNMRSAFKSWYKRSSIFEWKRTPIREISIGHLISSQLIIIINTYFLKSMNVYLNVFKVTSTAVFQKRFVIIWLNKHFPLKIFFLSAFIFKVHKKRRKTQIFLLCNKYYKKFV